MKQFRQYYQYLLLLAAGMLSLLGSCQTYDNATTYFNTYYNIGKLMWETEYEFEGADIIKRQKPRVFVPVDSGMRFGATNYGKPPETPQFLKDIIIDATKLQPVAVKLDSIIIKGSKILKLHPRSDYVEGTLYNMGKAFFYKNEWVPAEIKCSELIDRFPLGDLSPDAHLLLSKTYLIQRKYALGKNMLSRTVDIAWQKKRYDVLSEAFRLMAEQALFDEDVDGAVRPYRQAIAQCDDGELRARWQLELAALYYRLSKFEKAEKEFEKVLDESPELIAVFEAELYRASSLSYQRKFRQAAVILEDLNSNDNYKEWRHAIHAEKMRMMRLDTATSANEMDKVEKEAEKFTGSTAIPVALFEKAMDYFHAGKYTEAKLYYAKAKAIKSPVSEAAGKYFQLLNEWENKQKQLGKGLTIMDSLKKQDTSLVTEGMKGAECMAMYQLGRIHEQLENADSADFYYLKAATMVSPADTNRPRYLYGLQRRLIAKDPDRADSLMEILAYNYGKTPYGQEARLKLGFTEAVVIDTVAELYISGTRFRATNNYELAIRQFIRIAEGWRESAYAPKALYSTGWIFENKLLNKDSAIYYYRLLVERYPQSDYAKDIRPGVEMALAYQSGMYDPATGQMLKPGQKPDTTGNAGRPAIQAVPDSVVKAGQPPRNADTVMQVKDSVPKNPANMLQNQMNSLQNQINSIPTDMKSLEKMKPDIKVTTPFDKLIPNQMPSLPFFGKDKNPAPTDSVKKDGPP